MIASNDEGSFDFAGADEIVEDQTRLVTFAVTEPADACGQALKRHSLFSARQPADQVILLRESIHQCAISDENIIGIARERSPAEWSRAFAKERANVFGHKARNLEGIF